MSRQVIRVGFLRMRNLHLRGALMRGAAGFHFAARGLRLNSALTGEGVIGTFHLVNHRAVLISVVDSGAVYV